MSDSERSGLFSFFEMTCFSWDLNSSSLMWNFFFSDFLALRLSLLLFKILELLSCESFSSGMDSNQHRVKVEFFMYWPLIFFKLLQFSSLFNFFMSNFCPFLLKLESLCKLFRICSEQDSSMFSLFSETLGWSTSSRLGYCMFRPCRIRIFDFCFLLPLLLLLFSLRLKRLLCLSSLDVLLGTQPPLFFTVFCLLLLCMSEPSRKL